CGFAEYPHGQAGSLNSVTRITTRSIVEWLDGRRARACDPLRDYACSRASRAARISHTAARNTATNDGSRIPKTVAYRAGVEPPKTGVACSTTPATINANTRRLSDAGASEGKRASTQRASRPAPIMTAGMNRDATC